MPDTRLSFKEMCAKFDVTARTLRYYEYIELLSPEKDGRSRLYGPKEVARMTLILRGRRFGFSLEEIRQWLCDLRKGRHAAAAGNLRRIRRPPAARTCSRQRDEIDASIGELADLRDTALEELKKLP